MVRTEEGSESAERPHSVDETGHPLVHQPEQEVEGHFRHSAQVLRPQAKRPDLLVQEHAALLLLLVLHF